MKKLVTLIAFTLVIFTVNAQSCPDNNHPHAIDLGLPSGTLWSCCNVGASSPQEDGGFYAWGEIETKNNYNDVTYKYSSGVDDDNDGWYDNNTEKYQNIGSNISGTQYDVAYMKWGKQWRMPTIYQLEELLEKCGHVVVSYQVGNKARCLKLIGPNGHSIIMPESGVAIGKKIEDRDIFDLRYWSETTKTNGKSEDAYSCRLSGSVETFRKAGIPVRPIYVGEKKPDKPLQVKYCPDNNHPHVIDLGLPSGTLWSCCNVGAYSPEGSGGTYAWGETEVKAVYNEETYKYSSDIGSNICGTQYDVAHVKLGGSWQMPTIEQLSELSNICVNTWTTFNSVNGRLFIGANGNSIFLPACSEGIEFFSELPTFSGNYWAGTQSSGVQYEVLKGRGVLIGAGTQGLNFDKNFKNTNMESYKRYSGLNVRPIWVGPAPKPVQPPTSKPKPAQKPTSKPKPATTTDVKSYLKCPDGNHPHLIDMGLPSGTKWACCNMGANKPEDNGDYYAFGETETKISYDRHNYTDSIKNSYNTIKSKICGTNFDVVHVKMGGTWQMPTYNQLEELIKYCTNTWTSMNGVNGRIFTSKNGASIFLPAADGKDGHPDYERNSRGLYWTGDQNYSELAYNEFSWALNFNNEDVRFIQDTKHFGLTVRPVWVRPIPKPSNTSLCPDSNHPHAIDLGLPSGTKWACCNVGATTQEAYGGYYAWGETEEKDSYSWSNYVYGTWNNCQNIGRNIAGTQYDVAHVKWGKEWMMPSLDQIKELEEYCIRSWTTLNGINGYLINSNNGNRIFLPAAGYDKNLIGTLGSYSLETLYEGDDNVTYFLNFNDDRFINDIRNRSCGYSVRPVWGRPFSKLSNSFCPDDHHPHAIDLGLPSGTKWACCNVDTDHPGNQSPTNYGGYYAWGETKEHENLIYNWSTYTHCDGSKATCHNLGSDIAGTQYDVAHYSWGASWVMPTLDQFKELHDNCSIQWTTVGFINGRSFTGPNGSTIFLPAAGGCASENFLGVGSEGDYWFSTQNPSRSNEAYYFGFGSDMENASYINRYFGLTVRPVSR